MKVELSGTGGMWACCAAADRALGRVVRGPAGVGQGPGRPGSDRPPRAAYAVAPDLLS